MATQRDRTKLPKWAQTLIETLERNVDHWKDRYEAAVAADPNLKVDGNRVEFKLDDGGYVSVKRLENGDLEVLSMGNFSKRVGVFPFTGNGFIIGHKDRS